MLAETEIVPTVESLGDESILDPVETHAFDLDPIPGRPRAKKLALMGAGQRPPGQHLVALGHKVGALKVQVWEGRSPFAPLRAESLAARTEIGVVSGGIDGDELVNRRFIALVPNSLEKRRRQSFVLFSRHQVVPFHPLSIRRDTLRILHRVLRRGFALRRRTIWGFGSRRCLLACVTTDPSDSSCHPIAGEGRVRSDDMTRDSMIVTTRRMLLGIAGTLGEIMLGGSRRSGMAQDSGHSYSLPVGRPGHVLGDGFSLRHGMSCENTCYLPGWWHAGEDYYLAGNLDAAGENVYAVAGGEIVYAGSDYPGLVVIVKHEADVYSMYGHLNGNLAVESGPVQRGQLLGTIFRRTDGIAPSHLHFELRNFFTATEVNGDAPRYPLSCGYQCPPGPGYWPMAAQELPSAMGWFNPSHAIAKRAFAGAVPPALKRSCPAARARRRRSGRSQLTIQTRSISGTYRWTGEINSAYSRSPPDESQSISRAPKDTGSGTGSRRPALAASGFRPPFPWRMRPVQMVGHPQSVLTSCRS